MTHHIILYFNVHTLTAFYILLRILAFLVWTNPTKYSTRFSTMKVECISSTIEDLEFAQYSPLSSFNIRYFVDLPTREVDYIQMDKPLTGFPHLGNTYCFSFLNIIDWSIAPPSPYVKILIQVWDVALVANHNLRTVWTHNKYDPADL